MASASPATSRRTLELLRQACARNTSVELRVDHAIQGSVTARARLLGVDAEQVYLDRPQIVGAELRFTSGQPVTVYFLLSGKRYAFRSRVRRVACNIQLNTDLRVTGTSIHLPAEIKEQQRRAEFRLSLASHKDLYAEVQGGTGDTGGSCPIDGPRCRLRLMNISAGGCGGLLDGAGAGSCKSGDVFFISFTLPEIDGLFLLMAKLQHIREVQGGGSLFVGLQFVPWAVVPMQTFIRKIRRFIASEQRRQLQRGR